VFPEIHDPPAGLIGNIRIPDRPLIRDRPVKGSSAGRHAVTLKSWEQLSQVLESFPNSGTGETPADWKEIPCPAKHRLARQEDFRRHYLVAFTMYTSERIRSSSSCTVLRSI